MRLKKLNLLLIFLLKIVIIKVNCDLSLFSNEDLHNRDQIQDVNSNSFDRLHLFPNSKDCSNEINLDEVDKTVLCKDYCLSKNENLKDENKTEKNKQNDVLKSLYLTQNEQSIQTDFNHLNLTGALNYYKNFVHVFLAYIKNQQQENEDIYEYKIGVELNKHQIIKLESFADSLSDADAVDKIQDITDTLKYMFVRIESNKEPSLSENFFDFIHKIKLIDVVILKHVYIFFAIVTSCAIFYAYVKKFGFKITWRKVIATLLFSLFVVSVINNHIYLSQKKQILNQQKLKEFVPQECLIKNEQKQEQKDVYSKLISVVKFQLGYTATSRRCLEYHEALFVASSHNNYIESVVYTISEGFKPIAVLCGDFINQFFSALTKDLSFYQYMPLIGLVTTVFLPLAFIILCFLSLLLFGYDFNFFHLISLKKNKSETKNKDLIDYKKDELLKILSILKIETEKLALQSANENEPKSLQYQNIDSTNDLLSIENSKSGDNLNDVFDKNIKKIFEKIQRKELNLQSQIENLKCENEKLKQVIIQNDSSFKENCDEEESVEEMRCLSIEHHSNDKLKDDFKKEPMQPSKEISIGLSKTVKNSSSSSKKLSSQLRAQMRSNKYQNDDDDDDEEDIYVILDEN